MHTGFVYWKLKMLIKSNFKDINKWGDILCSWGGHGNPLQYSCLEVEANGGSADSRCGQSLGVCPKRTVIMHLSQGLQLPRWCMSPQMHGARRVVLTLIWHKPEQIGQRWFWNPTTLLSGFLRNCLEKDRGEYSLCPHMSRSRPRLGASRVS